MQNILVTGGCGFIGSNFIRFLFEDSTFTGKVINVDLLTYAGSTENLVDISENFTKRYIFIKTDICDRIKIEQIFDEYEIDTICHFAAESHVDRSIIYPDSFIRTNVLGTYTLLDVARKHISKIYRFHHISTDEIYGSLCEEKFATEESPYNPSSPYSASKAASNHIVSAYFHTYGLPVTISNCSNNYGPYQFPEKLIPLIIMNAINHKPLPIYGDGKNIRDWIYVKDHCVAIWSILNNGKIGETYNIGGDITIENIEVVTTICNILDKTIGFLPTGEKHKTLVKYVEDRLGHDRRYALNCSKLKESLGWIPKESFLTGLDKTIKWYLNNKIWITNRQHSF